MLLTILIAGVAAIFGDCMGLSAHVITESDCLLFDHLIEVWSSISLGSCVLAMKVVVFNSFENVFHHLSLPRQMLRAAQAVVIVAMIEEA